jgi:hypothetical protein
MISLAQRRSRKICHGRISIPSSVLLGLVSIAGEGVGTDLTAIDHTDWRQDITLLIRYSSLSVWGPRENRFLTHLMANLIFVYT